MEEGDVIDAIGKMRKELADPLAALAVLMEFPARFDNAAFVLMAAATESLHGNRLAVHADHGGFIVERVDMARAAVHEEEDDAFGLGRKRRRARSERIGGGAGEGAIGGKQRGESRSAEAAA